MSKENNSTSEQICKTCGGLGGRASRYGPPVVTLPDGRLSGWTVGGKKDCASCGGTGFSEAAAEDQNSNKAAKNSFVPRTESPLSALQQGFVFRPDAAQFLRQLADHVGSVVDGQRVKVTVDIQMEK